MGAASMTDKVSEDCAKTLQEIEDRLSSRLRTFPATNETSEFAIAVAQALDGMTTADFHDAKTKVDPDCREILDKIDEALASPSVILGFRVRSSAQIRAKLENLLAALRAARER